MERREKEKASPAKTVESVACSTGFSPPFLNNKRASAKRIASERAPETLPLKKCLILVPSPVSTVSDNSQIEEDLYSCMEWVKKRERRVVGLLSCALSAGYSPRNRSILVHWMSEFCFDHHLHRETFHLAVNILDRFMSSPGVERLHRGDLQLLGIVALDLSIKYAEPVKASPRLLLKLSGITKEETISRVTQLERLLLESLEWKIATVTLVAVIWRLGNIVKPLLKESLETVALRCFYLCDFLILHPSFYDYSLFDLAVNVLRTVSTPALLQNSNLLCRVWVEEAWTKVRGCKPKDEHPSVSLQSFHPSFLSHLSI